MSLEGKGKQQGRYEDGLPQQVGVGPDLTRRKGRDHGYRQMGSGGAQLSSVLAAQSAAISFDVLDARGRIALELPPPLPEQKLDGGEVTLLNSQILVELRPCKGLKVFPGDLEAQCKQLPDLSSLETLE